MVSLRISVQLSLKHVREHCLSGCFGRGVTADVRTLLLTRRTKGSLSWFLLPFHLRANLCGLIELIRCYPTHFFEFLSVGLRKARRRVQSFTEARMLLQTLAPEREGTPLYFPP